MSDTPNQPNSIPNSNPTNPNLNPANPNSNSTNSNPPTTPSTQTNVAFRSEAIGKQTARPQDYFAEQNQKTAAKKENQSRQTKRILIIVGIILGVLLIAGLIWFIVTKIVTPETTSIATPEEVQNKVTTTYDDAYKVAMGQTTDTEDDENNDQESEGNTDEIVTGEPTEESINAATEIYDQAINEARQDKNLANSLRLSQMELYIELGDRYEQILQISTEINPDDLSIDDQIRYYNYIAEAYWVLGDENKAYYYYDLLFKVSGAEEYGE